jgi:hypothetical protein
VQLRRCKRRNKGIEGKPWTFKVCASCLAWVLVRSIEGVQAVCDRVVLVTG